MQDSKVLASYLTYITYAKVSLLSPVAAPAPCESWELPCDRQAEILSLKTKHTLRSCYTASTLWTNEEAAGCCQNPTAHLSGSITTGCDITHTSVHLGNKSEALSPHLAQAHAVSGVSAGTSGATASAAGTATSHGQPCSCFHSHYLLAGGSPSTDSIAQEWPPPRPSGCSPAGGPTDMGTRHTRSRPPQPPGTSCPRMGRTCRKHCGEKRRSGSCQRETTMQGQSQLAPGTACTYALTRSDTHTQLLPANPQSQLGLIKSSSAGWQVKGRLFSLPS